MGGSQVDNKFVKLRYFCNNFVCIITRMKQINGSGSKQRPNKPSFLSLPLVMVHPPPVKTQDEPVSNVLSGQEIKELKVSEEKLEDFLSKLGNLKNTAPLKSIRQNYKESSVINLTADSILQFCQTRVSKMIKNHRLKKNWGTEDIFLLVWLLSKYMEFFGITAWEQLNDEDWQAISAMIPGSNPQDCQFKWLNLNKNKLGDYSWTQEQSRILSNLVSQYGLDNWKVVAQKLYLLHKTKKKIFRTAKQCKERWSCYENPVIKKGQWTPQEDKILMQEVYRNGGLRKWCQISKILHERTQNAIKNRYKLLLEKEQGQVQRDIRHDTLEVVHHFLVRNGIPVQDIKIESWEELSAQKNENSDGKSQTSIKFSDNKNDLIQLRPDRKSAFSYYSISDNEDLPSKQEYCSEIRQTLEVGYNFMKCLYNCENEQMQDERAEKHRDEETRKSMSQMDEEMGENEGRKGRYKSRARRVKEGN